MGRLTQVMMCLVTTAVDQTEPYSTLDASLLKVGSRGLFDAISFLCTEFCMAYRYPDSLQLDRTPSASEYPCGWIREMRSLRWQSSGMHEGHYIYMKLTFGGKSALSLPWFSTTLRT